MMSLSLKRIAVLPQGAFGVLLWYGIPFAVSIERTYDGPRGVQLTKIRPGVFRCYRGLFHGYDTWHIDVPGHSGIVFHRGNVESDVDGCIAVGEMFGVLNSSHAILQSGVAFSEMMALTADVDEFYLSVTNV